MKIALIAHDKKKDEIIEFAKKYKDVLANHELFATGTTGTLIMGETALPIKRMKKILPRRQALILYDVGVIVTRTDNRKTHLSLLALFQQRG